MRWSVGLADWMRTVTGVDRRRSACTSVVGLQWGDEGKGKVVDLLAPRFDAVVRYNGGANAGHSVVVKGKRHALHLVPCGVLNPGTMGVIANGVVVDPDVLAREIAQLEEQGIDLSGLVISDRAHVVMPYHKAEDELRERILTTAGPEMGGEPIGTTKRGIGPAYADKAHRATAVRVCDLLDVQGLRKRLERVCAFKDAMFEGLCRFAGTDPVRFDAAELTDWGARMGEMLQSRVRDTSYLLNEMIADGKSLLMEGANATLLDVDHGTHPFVTSSSTTSLGIPQGTGLASRHVGRVIGVMKSYSTRVGNGPLPTEQKNAIGDGIRERGREYGTTTGRPRRVGWLDLVAVRYAVMLNGVTELAITLLDVLSGLERLEVCTSYEIEGRSTTRFVPDAGRMAGVRAAYENIPGFEGDLSDCRAFNDLPHGAQEYVRFVERFVGVPVTIVSVGPDREQTILRGDLMNITVCA